MPSKKTATGDEGKAVGFSRRFCCLSCCPARKSCRKRTACGMRYSCAKFVKYDLRFGLARVAGCGRVSADTQRCRSTTTTRMGDKAKPPVARRLCCVRTASDARSRWQTKSNLCLKSARRKTAAEIILAASQSIDRGSMKAVLTGVLRLISKLDAIEGGQLLRACRKQLWS